FAKAIDVPEPAERRHLPDWQRATAIGEGTGLVADRVRRYSLWFGRAIAHENRESQKHRNSHPDHDFLTEPDPALPAFLPFLLSGGSEALHKAANNCCGVYRALILLPASRFARRRMRDGSPRDCDSHHKKGFLRAPMREPGAAAWDEPSQGGPADGGD